MPATGLRFFTVYGPWGRPDIALFNFTKKNLADVAALTDDVGYKPDTPIEEGIKNFIDCYRG